MAAIDSVNARIATKRGTAARRRAVEFVTLAVTSLAFLFALAVTFGFIGG